MSTQINNDGDSNTNIIDQSTRISVSFTKVPCVRDCNLRLMRQAASGAIDQDNDNYLSLIELEDAGLMRIGRQTVCYTKYVLTKTGCVTLSKYEPIDEYLETKNNIVEYLRRHAQNTKNNPLFRCLLLISDEKKSTKLALLNMVDEGLIEFDGTRKQDRLEVIIVPWYFAELIK